MAMVKTVTGSRVRGRIGRLLRRPPHAVLWLGLILILLGGIAATSLQLSSGNSSSATVTARPQVVLLERNTQVLIAGSGFESNQEIFLAIVDKNGILTEISARLDPNVFSANEDGAFATIWGSSRFRFERIGGEGAFTLQVVDSTYNTIASTPLLLCDPDVSEAVFCSEQFIGK